MLTEVHKRRDQKLRRFTFVLNLICHGSEIFSLCQCDVFFYGDITGLICKAYGSIVCEISYILDAVCVASALELVT